MAANSCIQLEERERIDKFVFQKDAKAAMVWTDSLVFQLVH